jgi:hypothetical protein
VPPGGSQEVRARLTLFVHLLGSKLWGRSVGFDDQRYLNGLAVLKSYHSCGWQGRNSYLPPVIRLGWIAHARSVGWGVTLPHWFQYSVPARCVLRLPVRVLLYFY